VEAPADSEFRKKLEQDEPELAKWMQTHEAALKEAALQLEGGFTQFDTIQKENQAVVDNLAVVLGGDSAAAQDLLKSLFPDFKPGMMASKLDTSGTPGLQALLDPAGAGFENPQVLVSQLKQISGLSPEAAAHLMRMTPEEMRGIGVGDPDSDTFQRWTQYVQDWKGLQSLNPEDPESVVDYLFGEQESLASVQKRFEREMAAAKITGKPSPWLEKAQGILDSDGNGKIDGGAQMIAGAKKSLGGGSGIDPRKLDRKQSYIVGDLHGGPNSTLGMQLADAAADGRLEREEVAPFLAGAGLGSLHTLLNTEGVKLSSTAKHDILNEIGARAVTDMKTTAYSKYNLSDAELDAAISLNFDKIASPRGAMDRIRGAWQTLSDEWKKVENQYGAGKAYQMFSKQIDRLRAAEQALGRYVQQKGL
jgi:hypothetical protein